MKHKKYYCFICKKIIKINEDQFYLFDIYNFNNIKRKSIQIKKDILLCKNCFKEQLIKLNEKSI